MRIALALRVTTPCSGRDLEEFLMKLIRMMLMSPPAGNTMAVIRCCPHCNGRKLYDHNAAVYSLH